jgi:hypothetical protein
VFASKRKENRRQARGSGIGAGGGRKKKMSGGIHDSGCAK